MHVLYDPDLEDWDQFFNRQIGGNSYFEGVPYLRGSPQTGAGLGTAFAGFMRFLIPLAKTYGPVLAEEGLALGSRLMGQLAQGESLKQTLKKESKQTLKNLVGKVDSRLQNGQGKRKRKSPNFGHSLIGKRLRTAAPLISSSSSKQPLDPFE